MTDEENWKTVASKKAKFVRKEPRLSDSSGDAPRSTEHGNRKRSLRPLDHSGMSSSTTSVQSYPNTQQQQLPPGISPAPGNSSGPPPEPLSLEAAYPPHPAWSAPSQTDSPEERTARRRNRGAVNFRINKSLVAADNADDILWVVANNLRLFNFVNLGTALYRLAVIAQPLTPLHKQHLRSDPRLRGLVGEVCDTLEIDVQADRSDQLVLAPKELSNIVWATTKLGLADTELFSKVEKHLLKYMGLFDSVNLSLTLWGFAKMDMKSEGVFRAAGPRVLELLPEFEPHRICNTVWAFAKSGFVDAVLFKAVAEECLRKVTRFNHSNESMLLYSYALAGVKVPLLFSKMMGRQLPAIKSREVADPRSLSNLLWALAELGLQNDFPEAFAVIGASSIENIHRYSLTHMATLCSAYAKAGVENRALFELVTEECAGRDGVNDPGSLGDLMTLKESLSKFGYDSELLRAQIDKMTHLEVQAESPAEETKCNRLFWDLLGTSLTSVVVILVATMIKKFWGVRVGADDEA